MSGFTQRTVQRALGASGRIQPRIAPITAPDPWTSPGDAGLGLEVYEELEAREPSERALGPTRAPERPRTRPEAPRDQAAPREPTGVDEAVVASERPLARGLEAPVVPSFRAARAIEVVEGAAPPAAARVEPVEGLEQEATVVMPRSLRGPVSRRLARAGGAAAVRGLGEPRAIASDASVEAAEALPATMPTSRPTTMEPREARARGDELEVDLASFAGPSLEPRPTPRSRRGAADARGPVVRVEIGRVEVRASAPSPTPAPASINKPDAFVSLRKYLHERGDT